MVAPVTPYNTAIHLKTMELGPNGWFERNHISTIRYGYRQKPPYNVDTSLDYYRQYTVGKTFVSTGGMPNRAFANDLVQEALNKARAKFKSSIGDASQIGSTMTSELKATYGTVVGGIAKALLAAKHVSRGRIGEAGRLLGFHPPIVRKTVLRTAKRGKSRKKFRVQNEYWQMPDGRIVLKSLGNKWLWYSYGVRPLVDDLYNASSVFTREIPGTKILGKGYAEGIEGARSGSSHHHKANARVTAYVKVSNPNLWLANQLGLINPVQWFNEGVAFSFVIDWFSNWSDWLQQLTDFVGLEIEKPVTTYMLRSKNEWRHPGEYFSYFDVHFIKVIRRVGIPPVVLRFAYERFQWQRGANAVSLLVQFLKDKK